MKFQKVFSINLHVSWFKFIAYAALHVEELGFILKYSSTSTTFSSVVFVYDGPGK